MESNDKSELVKAKELENDLINNDEYYGPSANSFCMEPDEFFFESDHLALRGNKDYQKLLRAYVLLSAQKDEMLKNYDALNATLTLSQDNPLEFVNSLRSGELKLPERITPVNIPRIDLQQYENKVPEYLLNKAKNFYNEDKKQNFSDDKVDPYLIEKNHSNRSEKLWTVAEQRKLEDLLVRFPPEEVEMRRFAKIAKALGNRTTKQVASRIQKYFIKLHKAGLPVPGRLPKMRPGKRSLKNPVFHNAYSLIKPSTFFPTLNVPSGLQNLHNQETRNLKSEKLSESMESVSYTDEEVSESESNSDDSSAESDTVTVDKHALQIIKRVYKDKVKDGTRLYSIHIRHQCDFCEETPIIGTRWHCMDCTNRSVDFCSDCLIAQTEDLDNIVHPLSHNIVPFRSKQENKTNNIKRIDFKTENIENDKDSICFTVKAEAKYIGHLINQFKDNQISLQVFLNEILSLNLSKCEWTLQDKDGLKVTNLSVFLKDKIVTNIYTNLDILNDMFVDSSNELINTRLLSDIDKNILHEKIKLTSNNVITELLDHNYSVIRNLKFIKTECSEHDATISNFADLPSTSEWENDANDKLSYYSNNDNLVQTLQTSVSMIGDNDDPLNVGREEFV